MTDTTNTTRDFLAIALIGAGSSFGRAPEEHQAVAICKRQVERDWSSLFQLDGQGVHPDSDPTVCLPKLRVEKVTLSVPSQRKRTRKAR